ncbi:MAG: hypothetical protein ACTSP3_00025 [Candidatus Heimdallarchaeaceae archaeon]
MGLFEVKYHYRCWNIGKVKDVFTTESEQKFDDDIFLELHQPMTFYLTRDNGVELPEKQEYSQEELLNFFLKSDPTKRTIENLVAITGPPGSGKSQICKWLRIKLERESEVHEKKFMFYVTRDKMSPRILKKYLIEKIEKLGVSIEEAKKEFEKVNQITKITTNLIISSSLSDLAKKLRMSGSQFNSFLNYLAENISTVTKTMMDTVHPFMETYVEFYNYGKRDEEFDESDFTNLINKNKFLSIFKNFKQTDLVTEVYLIFTEILTEHFLASFKEAEITITSLFETILEKCPKDKRPIIIFEDMTTVGVQVSEVVNYFTNKAKPWDVVFAYTLNLETNVLRGKTHYLQRLDKRILTSESADETTHFLQDPENRYHFIEKYLSFVNSDSNCLEILSEKLDEESRKIYPFTKIFLENIFNCLPDKTPRGYLSVIKGILETSNIPPVAADTKLNSKQLGFQIIDPDIRNIFSKNKKLESLFKWYGENKEGTKIVDKYWADIYNITVSKKIVDNGKLFVKIISFDTIPSSQPADIIRKPKVDYTEFLENINNFIQGISGSFYDATEEKLLQALVRFNNEIIGIDLDAIIQNRACSDSVSLLYKDVHRNISPRIFFAREGSRIQRITYPHYHLTSTALKKHLVLNFLAKIVTSNYDIKKVTEQQLKDSIEPVSYLFYLLHSLYTDYKTNSLREFKARYGDIKEILITVKYLLNFSSLIEEQNSQILKVPINEEIKINQNENSLDSVPQIKSLYENLSQIAQKAEIWNGLFKSVFFSTSNIVNDKLLEYNDKEKIIKIVNKTLKKLSKVDLDKSKNFTEKFIIYASNRLPKSLKKDNVFIFNEIIKPLISVAKIIVELSLEREEFSNTYKEIDGAFETVQAFIAANNDYNKLEQALEILSTKAGRSQALMQFGRRINILLDKIDNCNFEILDNKIKQIQEIYKETETRRKTLVEEFTIVSKIFELISSETYSVLEKLMRLNDDLIYSMSLPDFDKGDILSDFEWETLEQAIIENKDVINRLKGLLNV